MLRSFVVAVNRPRIFTNKRIGALPFVNSWFYSWTVNTTAKESLSTQSDLVNLRDG